MNQIVIKIIFKLNYKHGCLESSIEKFVYDFYFSNSLTVAVGWSFVEANQKGEKERQEMKAPSLSADM